MINQELARMFYEIADILEIKGDQWRPVAYRKVARVLESLPDEVSEIYKERGLKGLQQIPGVGEAIAKKIEQYIKTGHLKKYEQLRNSLPKGLSEMMEVTGLGPKRVKVLYKKLGIKTLSQLEKACKDGKIRKLSGFGLKSEQDILKGIELSKKARERMLLGVALPIGREIKRRLEKSGFAKKVEICGSLRRMKETIGDIDILAISKHPEKLMDFFCSMPDLVRILAKGPTKSSIIIKPGIQIDLRVVPEEDFGSAMQYFIGSKEHSIALRRIVKARGMKLSEYGLFDRKTGKKLASRTEEEIYKKLGFKQVPPPELRENRGEIEAGIKGKLPKLVELRDIRGDLHTHTKWSEGSGTISQMVEMAKKLGYEYIGIADHSRSSKIARGLPTEKLLRQVAEIRKLNQRVKGIRIFAGIECDILPDGSLDYPNEVLEKLDFVIAAIHSRFKSSEREMTRRVLKALENPYVKILAHPTGRLINQRPSLNLDLEQVFQMARERGVALEINSQPDRLDLRDTHIQRAIEVGCKLVINTDAHSPEQMKFMELGVATARRGWAEKKHIINTLPLKKIEHLFKVK